MRIEHFAYIAADPAAVAAWYVAQFGWTVRRAETARPFTHFLADSGGQVMLEVYDNPAAAVPDYASMHPLVLHVAVACGPELEAIRDRLLAAGATPFEPLTITPLGDRLVMLRDPWGFALQLVDRRSGL